MTYKCLGVPPYTYLGYVQNSKYKALNFNCNFATTLW